MLQIPKTPHDWFTSCVTEMEFSADFNRSCNGRRGNLLICFCDDKHGREGGKFFCLCLSVSQHHSWDERHVEPKASEFSVKTTSNCRPLRKCGSCCSLFFCCCSACLMNKNHSATPGALWPLFGSAHLSACLTNYPLPTQGSNVNWCLCSGLAQYAATFQRPGLLFCVTCCHR